MATHSSILPCRMPWTEEPGRFQSMGSHRVRHDWSDLVCKQSTSGSSRTCPLQCRSLCPCDYQDAQLCSRPCCTLSTGQQTRPSQIFWMLLGLSHWGIPDSLAEGYVFSPHIINTRQRSHFPQPLYHFLQQLPGQFKYFHFAQHMDHLFFPELLITTLSNFVSLYRILARVLNPVSQYSVPKSRYSFLPSLIFQHLDQPYHRGESPCRCDDFGIRIQS